MNPNISSLKFLNKEGAMLTESRKAVRRFLIVLAVMLIVGLPSSLLAQQPPDPIQKDKLELGKRVYFKRCVWCHGVEGGGLAPFQMKLSSSTRRLYSPPLAQSAHDIY